MERRDFLEGFATARLVLDHDALTVEEIVDSLDPIAREPGVTPWKQGYRAGLRTAFGR